MEDLSSDLAWTIPIVLDVDESAANQMKEAGDVLLQNLPDLESQSYMLKNIYSFDKEKTVTGVYGTNDSSHPGVAKTNGMKGLSCKAAKLIIFKDHLRLKLENIDLLQFKQEKHLQKAGWKTICAFQTRNPPHVAHEMLQKTSITTRDGVFVNPIIGKKKSGDFVDEVIIKCYETMIKSYYPENRCRLGTLHTEMKYAGPKEAIHHAIMRQNYGCTHIIIRRDHAGVGKFYDPFAAQKIFDDYPELEITPVFFPAFFYCKRCLTYTNPKACSV